MSKRTEPRVIQVLDTSTVVINQGSDQGVSLGDRFLIYKLGDELVDPETNENLGRLEIVRGNAEATHVQERMTTLSSIKKRRIVSEYRNALSMFGSTQTTEDQILPLNSEAGDFARPV